MLLTAHGEPFNREGWTHILNRHGGRMPVEIQAAPEGLVLPPRNVMVQLHNTDEAVPWLTSYLETALLRAIWYPTTVATTSWHIKQIIRRYLHETADDPEAVLPFKLHDFGARGASSAESAAIGALAHLVNFRGSDTLGGGPGGAALLPGAHGRDLHSGGRTLDHHQLGPGARSGCLRQHGEAVQPAGRALFGGVRQL